ncbi:DUF6851 domain-containing protein [Roseivirga sp. UBA838]|uniref:DUF6851 domain-containing protein n=1 Tax=Roseivirga sp. UBA838 TaxID=1947393 RepID=UPI00257DEB32|nr:T9SS type A sorting domain-containing protein [Roseivirga sp. UBA838]
MHRALLAICLFFSVVSWGHAQHSVAREWNERLLHSIRNDLARPTVHARNLFHLSAAMYDAWAYLDPEAEPYLLGKTVNGFSCTSPALASLDKSSLDIEEVISHAAFRLLSHRFQKSPRYTSLYSRYRGLMTYMGYNPDNNKVALDGSSAAFGNFIGQCYIDYGLRDGSNEVNDYANQYYEPTNRPLAPMLSGNPSITNLNRFQQLALDVFIGQSGFSSGDLQPFLSPEWGNVMPFALNETDRVLKKRDGQNYWVYLDPGPPPMFDDFDNGGHDFYKWNFSLVSIWSAHLSPWDNVMWDISPGSIGNATELPETWDDYKEFYKRKQGGDAGSGHALNPKTGEPYAPNIVPRGDYTRVLAEFWADGPDSETPPGHWFTILNYVSDHPELQKKYKGEGQVLDDLEWDIKAYFVLGGAMHDAAVAAWSVKGFYDYIRPISAIRALADLGQSFDTRFNSFNRQGFTYEYNFIDVVDYDDPLLGFNQSGLGKVKVKAWRGPLYIPEPRTDMAGVDWIFAEDWWPYQRPTFVTPPFAGYVSGHSTFSRAAAEVLTLLTGDEYFPGGMGEFIARKNQFLVFEEGPSVDVKLQWATYRDASDQTSLSRIWGGIHPPVDDIPGRKMGIKIGHKAFEFAERFFNGKVPRRFGINHLSLEAAPNPVQRGELLTLSIFRDVENYRFILLEANAGMVEDVRITKQDGKVTIDTSTLAPGLYILRVNNGAVAQSIRFIVQ